MDHFRYENGRLWCEGVTGEALADRFGTPLYVYSGATLSDHVRRLGEAFEPLNPALCFSVKSCPNLGVLRRLVGLGAGLDVVSGGELERAFLAGCPMERVVFAGVGKSDAEILAALDGAHSPLLGTGLVDDAALRARGPIGLFNIESEPEFETIAAIARSKGVRARAALRVNPDVDPSTHAYTTTGTKETKFGVDVARARAFFERYGADPHLRLTGVHIHIGSPVYSPEPYVRALEKVLALVDDLGRLGVEVTTLDVGGGFGADYESGRTPAYAAYADAIVPMLRERVRRGLRVVFEPGRTIAASAGVLLTRVLYVKRSLAKSFLVCDAGMHTLVRPSLYGAFHFIWPARVGPGHEPARRAPDLDLAGLEPFDVVGPICETGDFLARDRRLPPSRRGDVLAVFTAGAYGMAMASNYNAQPLPAEVLVSGSLATLVRRRQTIADLVGPELDPGPDRAG